MEKPIIQTSNIDKETFESIRSLRKGKALTKIKDFKGIKEDTYIFCLFPKKDSNIYKKKFAFSLCYMFQMQKNEKLRLIRLYGYQVPVAYSSYKCIPVSKLNIDGCSFNILNNEQYEMINKIVLANEIIKNNGKSNITTN